MKYCPNCGAELAEGSSVCTSCNSVVNGETAVAIVNEYDHTAEYTAEDIENNKIFAVLGYLIGIPGLIITYLAAKESPFAMYHAKQALKIEVASLIALVAVSVLWWTCIVLIAGVIFICILAVLDIIAIFHVFGGKAKDLWLVRSLKFLGK